MTVLRRLLLAALAFALAAEAGDRLYRRLVSRRAALPPQSFEFYAVGESTAAGVPYPRRTAFPFLVKKIMGGTIGRRTIFVRDLAEAGESIYPQATALERALIGRHRENPGVVFIYAGHNDAGYEDQTPLFEFFKEDILFRSAALRDLFFLAEKRHWIERTRTLHTYEFHLRRAIEQSLRAGLTPIVATTASNVRDMDPGSVSHARFETALRRYRDGHFKAAAALFRACLEARDPDNFGRSTMAQNALVRRLAGEYSIPLVDTVALFEANSPHGLPGDDLFIDGQHPNFRGYVLLAGAFANAVSRATSAPIFEPLVYSPDVLDRLQCSRTEQAEAEVEAGRWLFSVSVQHPFPGRRLDMADARFRRALTLDPGSFSAQLGLALTAAAHQEGFLDRNIDWLGRNRLFYGGRYDVTKALLPEILERLKAGGVPSSQLESLAIAH